MTRDHEPLAQTLLRLKQERDEADRRYNDALTALDSALLTLPDLPPPPAEYDERQITPLNGAWDIGVAAPRAGGLKGRLAAFVWSIVGPIFQKQLTFNSVLVDHLNRTAAAHRDAKRAIDAILG